MKLLSKKSFYLLSWTWGLPMALIGGITMLILMIAGKKPKRWGDCYYIEVGKDWGGLNFGMFFLTSEKPSRYTKNHEHGHAIQNCYFGFLTPFLITIPSAVRYWYRELKYHKKGIVPPTDYDDIWFEGQATELGTDYVCGRYY